MKEHNLTTRLMSEIGLDTDNKNHIVDQDTGSVLRFNGKSLKLIESDDDYVSKNETVFNPVENIKLMNHLFSYYINKIHEEDGRYVNIYYPVANDSRDSKTAMELKEITENKTIRSAKYSNSNLGYIDLIFRLNGEEDFDLTIYDNKN